MTTPLRHLAVKDSAPPKESQLYDSLWEMLKVWRNVILHRPLAAKNLKHGVPWAWGRNLNNGVLVKHSSVDCVDVVLAEREVGRFVFNHSIIYEF